MGMGMSVQLTIVNDDVYDTNHLDDRIVQDVSLLQAACGSTVINFHTEVKKKDYAEAMERIAAAADEFDW